MERFFSYLVIQLQRNGSCGFCVMNNTTRSLCSVINYTFLGKSYSVIRQGEARSHRLFCIERLVITSFCTAGVDLRVFQAKTKRFLPMLIRSAK
jgi:hypothetical protein